MNKNNIYLHTESNKQQKIRRKEKDYNKKFKKITLS